MSLNKHLAGKHDQQTHAGEMAAQPAKKISKKDEENAQRKLRLRGILSMPEFMQMYSNPAYRDLLERGAEELSKKYTAEDIRRDASKIKKANDKIADIKKAVADGVKVASIPLSFVAGPLINYAINKGFMSVGLRKVRKDMGDIESTEDVTKQRDNLKKDELDKTINLNDFIFGRAGATALAVMGGVYAADRLSSSIKKSADKNIIQSMLAGQIETTNKLREALMYQTQEELSSSAALSSKSLTSLDFSELDIESKRFIQNMDELSELAIEKKAEGRIDANTYEAIIAMSSLLHMLDPLLEDVPAQELKHLAGQHDQVRHGGRNSEIMKYQATTAAEKKKRKELALRYANRPINRRLESRIKREIQLAGAAERKIRATRQVRQNVSNDEMKKQFLSGLGTVARQAATFLLTDPEGQKLLVSGVRAGAKGASTAAKKTSEAVGSWNDPYKDDPYKENYPKAHWWHEDTKADIERKRKQAKVRDYVKEMARTGVPRDQWNAEYRELAKVWGFAKSKVNLEAWLPEDSSLVVNKASYATQSSLEVAPVAKERSGFIITLDAYSDTGRDIYIRKSGNGLLDSNLRESLKYAVAKSIEAVDAGLISKAFVSPDLGAPLSMFEDWKIASNRLDKLDVQALIKSVVKDDQLFEIDINKGVNFRTVYSAMGMKKSRYLTFESTEPLGVVAKGLYGREWVRLLCGTDAGAQDMLLMYEKHLAGQHDQLRHSGLSSTLSDAVDATVQGAKRVGRWAAENPEKAIGTGVLVAGAAAAVGTAGTKIARRLEVANKERKEEQIKKKLHQTVRNEFIIKEYLKKDNEDGPEQRAWKAKAAAHVSYFNEAQHSKNLQRTDLVAFHKHSTVLVAEAKKLFSNIYFEDYAR